jgi:D-galactose 1-dehydrogenase
LIKIAVIGVGKIAHEEHIPAIKKSKNFQLVATVVNLNQFEELPNFSSLEELYKSGIDVDAVALCMPPEPRFDIALKAIGCGYHVLLEKPPCLSIAECKILLEASRAQGVCVFAAWHSKYAASINTAADWIKTQGCDRFKITWKEDVLKWHPNQNWFAEEGGFGVFDPGINALSILSALFKDEFHPSDVNFYKPRNWKTPIAATFNLKNSQGLFGSLELDWRNTGSEIYEMCFFSGQQTLFLTEGGQNLLINEEKIITETNLIQEYEGVYEHFSRLVALNESEIDIKPLGCTLAIFKSAIWSELPSFLLDD